MVLESDTDPIDEPRDSPSRIGVPSSEARAEQDRPTSAEDQARSSHDELRRAAESALRTAKILGDAGYKVAARRAVASTDRAIGIGGRTAKAVAKWILN